MKARYQIAVAATVLVTSSCNSRPVTPSPISTRLQDELIPKIIHWSKGREPTLALADLIPSHDFDALCVLPEYRQLDDLDTGRFGDVARFHSSFGRSIPEGSTALIIVENKTTHAALIREAEIAFGGKPIGTCVIATKAIFQRIANPRFRYTPVVHLGER